MSLAQFAFAGPIRTVAFERSASIKSTIYIKRDVSTVTFDNVQEYKNQTKTRQLIIQNTIQFAKFSGLDDAGAEAVSLP